MQGLQDPKQSNLDNLNNVRRQAFQGGKKKEYMKDKIDEL